MRDNGWLRSAVVGLVVLGLYLGVYGVLRYRRVLVRTGWFHNVYVTTPTTRVLAPEAGWRDCDIVPAGAGGGRWVAAFRPAIGVERLFWNTFGRRVKPL